MPKNGPLNTPFGEPLVSTPDPGSGTTRGNTISPNMGASAGLVSTPFEKPLASDPGPSETPNSGGLPPLTWTVGNIPNAPSEGSTVEVAGQVATPNSPAGNIDQK